MDKIFVMNLGSTSFKFKLYAFEGADSQVLATGDLESIGSAQSAYEIAYPDGRSHKSSAHIADHGAAFAHCFAILQADGILRDMDDLTAVGYKAVHGGNLSGTCLVDDALIAEMERVTPFAPAHNPIYLNAMKTIRSRFPGLTQVARFETSFHGTIPEKRVTYGVPYAWKDAVGIRRYGFHGSSHQYISQTVAKLQPGARRIISCHLGGSSSICAILDGKSVANSMGATLQTGLFNNNRVGDFEVFCLKPVMDHYGYTLDETLTILSKEAGLLGLSGVSNDLRLVLEAADAGNAQAKLAVETLADNILGYIGMYAAYLNGLDALVFTGGIGTNSAVLRQMVCDGLGYLGLTLDPQKNAGRGDGSISTDDSRVNVWRLKTDEESVVAACVREFISNR